MHRNFRQLIQALVLGASALLAGCVAPPAELAQGRDVGATLRATGPAVFVNGRPARDGMPVRPGVTVRTGPGSSALLRWDDGTIVQLDENSDPLFEWDGRVLVVNVGFGWFLIDTGAMEVRVGNDLAEIGVGSRAFLHVRPGLSFEVFLAEGRVELLRPRGRSLSAGQKVRITPDGGLRYGTLAPGEIERLEERFRRWRFPRRPFVPRAPDFEPGPTKPPRDEPPPAPDPDRRAGPPPIDLFGIFGGILSGGGRETPDSPDRPPPPRDGADRGADRPEPVRPSYPVVRPRIGGAADRAIMVPIEPTPTIE